jgi:hypothetical protein
VDHGGDVIVHDPGVIVAGQLDQLRAGDVFGDVSPMLDGDRAILGSVDHERGNVDRGQDVAQVRLPIDLVPQHRVAGPAAVTHP